MSLNLNYWILKIYCFAWSFERADFYRDLADALERKVGIRDFLERSASNASLVGNTTSIRVYRAMATRLASGQGAALAELVLGIAPASDQLLMKAVDDAGKDKVQALSMCADAVEFQHRALRAIAGQLLVPALSIPVVGAICYIVAGIIEGIAASGAAPSVWQGFNGFVRWLAEAINAYAAVIAIAIVGAIVAVLYALPRWVGRMRLRVEGWPAAALYRDYNAAVVLSSMAVMLRSGKTMREALEALRSASRPWLRWHLMRIITALQDNPTDYIAAFGRGLMPPSVRARLASLMDSSKTFADALVVLGTKEIAGLERRVRIAAAVLNWTLLGVATAVAVVLSLGTMTIASALAESSSPTNRLIQHAQPKG